MVNQKYRIIIRNLYETIDILFFLFFNLSTTFVSDDRGSNSSPLLAFDGTLYIGSGFGVVFAVDPQNGGRRS